MNQRMTLFASEFLRMNPVIVLMLSHGGNTRQVQNRREALQPKAPLGQTLLD